MSSELQVIFVVVAGSLVISGILAFVLITLWDRVKSIQKHIWEKDNLGNTNKMLAVKIEVLEDAVKLLVSRKPNECRGRMDPLEKQAFDSLVDVVLAHEKEIRELRDELRRKTDVTVFNCGGGVEVPAPKKYRPFGL